MRKLSVPIYIFLGILLCLFTAFQNCSEEHPQTTQTLMSSNSTFSHTNVTTNCASCHQSDFTSQHRPTDGRDCSACHTAQGWLPGDFQLDGIGHQPRAKSCLACHSQTDSPAMSLLPDGQAPVQGHYSGQDCVNCHEPSHPGFVFVHSTAVKGAITSCVQCHSSIGMAHHSDHPEYFTGAGACQTCHSTDKWMIDSNTLPLPSPFAIPTAALAAPSAMDIDSILASAFTKISEAFDTDQQSNCLLNSQSAPGDINSTQTTYSFSNKDGSTCPLALQLSRTVTPSATVDHQKTLHFQFTIQATTADESAALAFTSHSCQGTETQTTDSNGIPTLTAVHVSCTSALKLAGAVLSSLDINETNNLRMTQFSAAVDGQTFNFHQTTATDLNQSTYSLNGLPTAYQMKFGNYLLPKLILF